MEARLDRYIKEPKILTFDLFYNLTSLSFYYTIVSAGEIALFWSKEIVRETIHIANITWYIVAMLSGNDDFANKRYCGQRGYIILRDLLSKKQRDINLSKSIQHQARIIYNNIYRVYSGRVKIVTTSDENKKLTGSIFCYDGHCNKFQVHVDQLGSESPKVDQYRSNQLIPLDNISHLPQVECCNVDTHQFSLTTNLRSVQQYKYVMTFKHWIYIQLSKCENGRILDREETYDNFTHLVQTSNNIIESYQSEINDATQQVDKHIMTLPFQTENKTMATACSGLDYFDRTGDESFNEATILQSIGKYNIVINQSTLNRLRPFSKLNDELVNLAVNWYVFFFHSCFYSLLSICI